MKAVVEGSEWRPGITSIDFFRSMVSMLNKSMTSLELDQKEMAKRAALQLGVGVLSAPKEEQVGLVNAFNQLREDQPEIARAAYITLRETRVLPPKDLRKLLGLSLRSLTVSKQVPGTSDR